MRKSGFPKSVTEVVSTLIEIFNYQHRTEVLELLNSSSARFDDIEYDNWNGGTTTWALRLEVPVPIFAAVEPHLSGVEQEIKSKLGCFQRLFPNDPIGEVPI